MKKFTNKKGFTIMEMLIVVAIIAVLVAIAIPTFSSSLTKAKEAADVANIRAAYAEVQVNVLEGESVGTVEELFYDALTNTTYDSNDGSAEHATKEEAIAVLNYGTGGHGINLDNIAPITGTPSVSYKATKLKTSSGDTTFTWEF